MLPGKLWTSEYVLMSEDYPTRLELLVEPTISFSSLPWIGPACASQNGRRYQYPQNLHGSTSAEYATQNLETALQHQPSQNVLPFAVTNQLSPVFWANLLNFGSSKACCLSDHIWSRLPYQDQPNLHPNLLFARVHHHRSCLWCWEPQAWYTSSTTWDTQKHCPEWLIL